jgi:hypothetical protein
MMICAVGCGSCARRDGIPFYVSGPFDNPTRVMRTLTSSVGDGNVQFITPFEAAAR